MCSTWDMLYTSGTCEFDNNVNLVIRLAQFGNFGELVHIYMHSALISIQIQPEWGKCNAVAQYIVWV